MSSNSFKDRSAPNTSALASIHGCAFHEKAGGQAGISRLVGQPADGCESHIRGSRRQPAAFEVNAVTGDNRLVEGQARL